MKVRDTQRRHQPTTMRWFQDTDFGGRGLKENPRTVCCVFNIEFDYARKAFLPEPAIAARGDAAFEHGMRAADGWMSGERQLLLWCKNSQPIVGVARRRGQNESRFRKIRPRRDALHRGAGKHFRAQDDSDRIAEEWFSGKDVDLLKGKEVHELESSVEAE